MLRLVAKKILTIYTLILFIRINAAYYWARISQKVPYGCVNQTLVNVTIAKYYLVKKFPENLKQSSIILTNIWRLVAIYVIQVGA